MSHEVAAHVPLRPLKLTKSITLHRSMTCKTVRCRQLRFLILGFATDLIQINQIYIIYNKIQYLILLGLLNFGELPLD